MNKCVSCGRPEAKLRRCTHELLCSICRRSPEHRIYGESFLIKTTGLSRAKLKCVDVAGYRTNIVNPRFSPERIYRWIDVMRYLDSNDLCIPEELK